MKRRTLLLTAIILFGIAAIGIWMIMEGNMKLSAPNKENHRALWMWLAKNPENWKWEWPGFQTMDREDITRPHADCFLCVQFNDARTCKGCPLNTRGIVADCLGNGDGFYIRYRDAVTTQTRTEYALKIANCWK